MRIIGMMSGTSYDAIDAVAVEIVAEGEGLSLTILGSVSEPYPEQLRTALAQQLPPALTSFEQVCRLDTEIGQAFARLAYRANELLCGGAAELVASHGQTVFHWVDGGVVNGTLQIGEPAWIAEHTGCTVVSNFRSRDVAAGGQGAPLVSLFDTMWLSGMPGTPIALNLGGIANITVVSGNPVAFDTGPANALMDAAVVSFTGGARRYDVDGELAARGTVSQKLLGRLLADPYYALPAPKTTGKELFHLAYLERAMFESETTSLDAPDVLATLVALTARTVSDAVRAAGGSVVVASGGGTSNPVLLAALRRQLAPVDLRVSDELGVPSALKEACAFALLGYLTVHNLPGTLAGYTGARHPRILGSITPGVDGLRLPPPLAVTPTSLRITVRE